MEVTIEGGTIEGASGAIYAGGASRYIIKGGSIRGTITASGQAQIDLHVLGSSVILDDQLVPVAFQTATPIFSTGGTIAGTLADGTDFSYQFGRSSGASFNVYSVPEPGTIGLLLCATPLLVFGYRRHTRCR